MAKIVVVGLGYVGLTTLVGFAKLGHDVIGLDIDADRTAYLSEAKVPFYEPGLEEELRRQVREKRLRFENTYEQAFDTDSKIAFICVSTPSSVSGNANLTFLTDAVKATAAMLSAGGIIIIKSTVPVGTCSRLDSELREKNIRVASNPEFLSEGTALEDFINPSRIVIGTGDEKVAESLLEIYRKVECEKIICNPASAETIKYASNGFLALKLSFVNELAALCDAAGASIASVKQGLASDPRVGTRFLEPGPGWGGSCFPKDTAELAASSRRLGSSMLTIEASIVSNTATKARIVENVVDWLGGDLSQKTIAIWGLTFKANTSDTRDSPASEIAGQISRRGARVQAFDPRAQLSLSDLDAVSFADSAISACRGADALIVLTEWPEFGHVDPNEVRSVMHGNSVVYDARRILHAQSWRSVFPHFRSLGEPVE